MKIFKYDGLYYPVIGNSAIWENRNYKVAFVKKLGGYVGIFSFLPHIGIKCKVKNIKKPYKQFVIDAINNHPQMILKKWYFDEKYQKDDYMWVVETTGKDYIGNIETAYSISWLTHLKAINKVICYGWSDKKKCAMGWSHRARCCFKKGDKIFEEKYGDDNTPYTQHGEKTIHGCADAMKAAENFARHVG
jgi:hypothetical protein